MANPLALDLGHILETTRDLWDELRGERLFITGGTGFFGCWLLESFAWAHDRLNLGAALVALTRDPGAFQRRAPHLAAHPAIHLHPGDVRMFDFPTGRFAGVIHAATEVSAQINPENELLLFDTIVTGTRRVLDFAVQAHAKKFLLTSSGAVYGKQPPELTHIPEDYPGGPDLADVRSAYGEGKRAAELLCALYAQQSELETKIARCFAFVGPYLPLDAHFAIGNFIRDGLRGEPIMVNGDGRAYRSYLYAADLAVWLWTIFFTGRSCRPYNVGSANAGTIHAVAESVSREFSPPPEVRIAKPTASGSVERIERYIPSVDRARQELGLTQLISLEQAIQRTIRWNTP